MDSWLSATENTIVLGHFPKMHSQWLPFMFCFKLTKTCLKKRNKNGKGSGLQSKLPRTTFTY